MENKKKKSKKKILIVILIITNFIVIIWAMKERSRADRLAGENLNLNQLLKGSRKSERILYYELGKRK